MFPHLLILFIYYSKEKDRRSYDKNSLLELEAHEHKIMHKHKEAVHYRPHGLELI